MRAQGYTLQSIPFGRDNLVTVPKQKTGAFNRRPFSISTEVQEFNMEFRKLGDMLQHMKKALLSMKNPDGSTNPYPEDEFLLCYGPPGQWKSWYELAEFARYKIQSEGCLNENTDDWSKYAYKLREWSLNQGFLPLANPKMHELVPGVPTGMNENYL